MRLRVSISRAATVLVTVAAFSFFGCNAELQAARFGIPPGVPPGPAAGNPQGWFVLTNSDTVNSTVSSAMGDVAHFITLYIEVGDSSIPLDVSIYDPGLYNPAGGNAQLDANLSPVDGVGTMRYLLFGPDQGNGTPDTVLANQTFGPDTPATEQQLVSLFQTATPRPGLYHLICEVEETVADIQDISVFGVHVPGHQVYSYNLTVGHVNEGLAGDPLAGGAFIEEPVTVFPLVLEVSPATDAQGQVCGVRFLTYDMEAQDNGIEPPETTVITRTGFVFSPPEVTPSGDARWASTDLGGVNPGSLDSDDQGIWQWDFSRISEATLEDAFGNLDPPIDLNIWSIQLINYGAPLRDFVNWPDVPSRPPFILFNPDRPRRIYLPEDDGSGPQRMEIGHSGTIVAGFPVIAEGQTSTVEVTVTLRNPHTYPLTNCVGETHVAPNADVTDPTLVSSTGLAVNLLGRDFDFGGDIPAGGTGSFVYSVDITPSTLDPEFLTGDGTDFVGATAPTVVQCDTPYVDPFGFELPTEVLGPICQIEYDPVIPPCTGIAEIIPSGPLDRCPGTTLTLDASGSEIFFCADIGGVPIYQWSVNGSPIFPFPDAAQTIDVTPFLNDTWTFEIACSTDPTGCIDSASVTFNLDEAPLVEAGEPVTICSGDSTTLTAVVSTNNPPLNGLQWTTNPPGQSGDGEVTESINVSPTATTTYTFSASDTVGCTTTDDVLVTISVPDPQITPLNAEICSGEPVVLTALTGFESYLWSSDPIGRAEDGSTNESVTVTIPATTWTVEVTDAFGCTAQVAVIVNPSNDSIPGALGPTLRVAKSIPNDLSITWTDTGDPVSDYQIVSLDCDSVLDGVCDVAPDLTNLDASTTTATEAEGVQIHIEADGLNRASHLVFYKIRGRSPCTSTPGPFLP